MEYNLQKFIFDNYTPKILDFELVRLNLYLLDIGRIIMCYCYENNSIDYYKMINFINGYNDIYLTYSLPNLIKHYTSNRSLIDYCFNYNINKRKILK